MSSSYKTGFQLALTGARQLDDQWTEQMRQEWHREAEASQERLKHDPTMDPDEIEEGAGFLSALKSRLSRPGSWPLLCNEIKAEQA